MSAEPAAGHAVDVSRPGLTAGALEAVAEVVAQLDAGIPSGSGPQSHARIVLALVEVHTDNGAGVVRSHRVKVASPWNGRAVMTSYTRDPRSPGGGIDAIFEAFFGKADDL